MYCSGPDNMMKPGRQWWLKGCRVLTDDSCPSKRYVRILTCGTCVCDLIKSTLDEVAGVFIRRAKSERRDTQGKCHVTREVEVGEMMLSG